MTDWYVEPETGGGTPAGAGTEGDPWNGFGNVDWTASGVQPADTLKPIGSFDNERLDIGGSGTNGNPITIDCSAATFSANTVSGSGDWLEVSAADPSSPSPGSNFWVLDTAIASAGKITAVWFNTDYHDGVAVQYWTPGTTSFTDVTAGNVPSSDRQFGFFAGGGGTNGHIGVYSVGNPVTYYGQVAWGVANGTTYRCVQATNKEYVTISGGTFSKASRGITLFNVTGSSQLDGLIITGVTFSNIDTGIHIDTANVDSWVDGIEIKNCTFTNCLTGGVVASDYVRGAQIHDNTFTRIGVTYSFGGVYFNNILADIANEIYSNTFSQCYGGYYWAGDGAGVGTDQNSRLTKIYGNTFSECWKAWHDNSGRENWFYNNRIYDCAMVSHQVDSGGNNNSEVYVYHNVGTGLSGDASYNGSGTDYASILRAENITYGAGGVNVKDNIFIGATGTENCLMRSDASTADWNEDYNCLWNVGNEVVDLSSNPEDQGVNAQNINPHLDTDYRPQQPYLSKAGIAVAGVTTDYTGRPYKDPPSIGAYELRAGNTMSTGWAIPPNIEQLVRTKGGR